MRQTTKRVKPDEDLFPVTRFTDHEKLQ